MKDKFFDHIIKDKLNTLLSQKSEGSWELLQKKMDVANLEEDMLLDKKISDEISGLSVPYNPSHWAQLKEKLELESYLKTRIYLSKVAEITMLFLLLFTLYNMYPTNPQWFDGEVRNIYAQESGSEATGSLVAVAEDSEDKIVENSAVSNKPTSLKTDRLIETITPVSLAMVSPLDFDNPRVLESSMLFSDIVVTENPEAIASASPDRNTDQVIATEIYNPESIALLQTSVEEQNRVAMGMMVNSPVEIKSHDKVSHAWNIGMGADINLINVPWDEVYSLPGYNLDETSVSGFAGVDFALNNELQLRTGIGYKRNSYEPRKVNERYGSTEEFFKETSLDRITYDIISVPMALNLSLYKRNGWNSYLSLGAALNIITKTDYLITETLRSDRSKPNAYPRSAPKLSEKEFVLGIADGGDISQNLYATASFGLGVEKRVSKGFSLYMQPTYYHHILNDAVGPNEDKLNSMSLQLGMKFDIN